MFEPKTKMDQERLGFSLQKLMMEDPSFRVRNDEETGQTLISGMGELHLEIIVDRMKREFKVDANVGKPMVAYRETIGGEAQAEGKFIRQTGGRGHYGHVVLKVEPLPTGTGIETIPVEGFDQSMALLVRSVMLGMKHAAPIICPPWTRLTKSTS